jgi:hypothetical protein
MNELPQVFISKYAKLNISLIKRDHWWLVQLKALLHSQENCLKRHRMQERRRFSTKLIILLISFTIQPSSSEEHVDQVSKLNNRNTDPFKATQNSISKTGFQRACFHHENHSIFTSVITISQTLPCPHVLQFRLSYRISGKHSRL